MRSRTFLLEHIDAETNDRHFVDDVFLRIFLIRNGYVLMRISLKCVSKAQIGDKSALVQVMDWRRIGDKPLPEPMMTKFHDAI